MLKKNALRRSSKNKKQRDNAKNRKKLKQNEKRLKRGENLKRKKSKERLKLSIGLLPTLMNISIIQMNFNQDTDQRRMMIIHTTKAKSKSNLMNKDNKRRINSMHREKRLNINPNKFIVQKLSPLKRK